MIKMTYNELSTFITCPLKYRFEYILKPMGQLKPESVSASMIFGKAIKAAVIEFYLKKKDGEDSVPGQLSAIYQDVWKKSKEENEEGKSRIEELKFSNGDTEENLALKADELLTSLCKDFDSSIEVIEVLKTLDVELSTSLRLIGTVDAIEEKNGQKTFVSIKTSSRKSSQGELNKDLKTTFLSLAETTEDQTQHDLIMFVKTKKPTLSRLTTVRNLADRDRFKSIAIAAVEAIKTDIWFPREDWHCASCSYQEACKNWR